MTGSDESLKPEVLSEKSEICQASLEAARSVVSPLFAELSDSNSVLYLVARERIAGLPVDESLGIAPLLLNDPSKSGVIIERYRQQEGGLPADADSKDPSKITALWEANLANIPKLKVPEGAEQAVMALADRTQMRGGGPVVFAREEVASVPHLPNTLLHVSGAARNANRERIQSALAYLEANGNPDQLIVATAKRSRVLQPPELEAVKGFAPDAENELELLIDSAIDRGFIAPKDNRYGVRFLSDGAAYLRMAHENGAQLLIMAPNMEFDEDGREQSGVFNAYNAFEHNPGLIGESFELEGSNIINFTSTHYGPMAVMNNLRAVNDLSTYVASYRVIGDNQPARTPQAHLIEIGFTTDAMWQVSRNPQIAATLLPEAI